MAVSTNSVIHYTNSLENIKGILSGGFRITYCIESISVPDTAGDSNLGGAFPMVCFCDIPLSNVKDHLESYGHYGIGLSKAWAQSCGMNPVLYVDDHSSLGSALLSRFQAVATADFKIDGNKWVNDFLTLAAYLKNHEGPLARGDKRIDRYRFYDEREWRFVPSVEQLKGSSGVITVSDYIGDKAKYNDAIAFRLSFKATDISYIIVHKSDEIPEVVKLLRNVYGDTCTASGLEILMTKVISSEQIVSDF